MATNAFIRVEGHPTVKIYKHFDGYPEGTLPWLEEFNREFAKNRGVDPEYKFAALLRSSMSDSERFGLDSSRYTGWGVVVDIPHDQFRETYVYTLHADGTVTVKPPYED